MSQPKVIVFGPTGNVGSYVATTAASHGAHVVLAMRDPSKSIKGISSDDKSYTRVKADLDNPESVSSAVKSSGATRAFFYLAHGARDHMAATIKALKSSGIEFIVFLSSYTVSGDKSAFTPQELIPFIHARVEMTLDEVYGEDNYVAIRPGGFATNLLRYKDGVNKGEVRIFGGAMKQDEITPGDMGRVAGTILAEGKAKNGQKKVYVYGPEMWTQTDALKLAGEVYGKKVEVTEIDKDEARQQMEAGHMPPIFVNYMLTELEKIQKKDREDKADGKKDLTTRAEFQTGIDNVELYTGRKSTGLKQWLEENKEMWQ